MSIWRRRDLGRGRARRLRDGPERFRLNKRTSMWARARNSGIFVCLPNPWLPDAAWEKGVEENLRHAREVLVEFRGLLREGKPLPDLEEEGRVAAEELLHRVFGEVGE